VADYTPVLGGSGEPLTCTAGAAITGGQLLAFTAADTVAPTSGPTLAFAGIAGHDAASGQPVSVIAGQGMVHDSPSTAMAAPAAPGLATAASGGTVAAGTYGVIVSYVNAQGESVGSAPASIVTTGATSTITITSPVAPPAAGAATGWYAYVTQAGGSTYTRQQAPGSPTAIGTPLVLTAPPTSGGAQPSATNTSGPQAGQLVAAAAGGVIAGGAAAGSELGVAIRSAAAVPVPVRWKTTRG
jgi:hypothetical protein